MNAKMFFKLFICVIASSLFIGCNKADVEVLAPLQVQSSDVFTLNATYGADGTRVAFDDDGLGLTWQPGDCLYLVDVSGTNSTVTLVTHIAEPSKTAAFRSTSSVLSGDYVVVYGRNNMNINKSISMRPADRISSEVVMCGSLSVADGQTSASITLSHVFAMLTFKFANLPVLSSMRLGMAVAEDGMIEAGKGEIDGKGYVSGSSSYTKFNEFGWNDGEEAKSLILPMDLSGKTVYFYVQGLDASGGYVTYEFVKSGKELCAGVNYNLTFDFAQASSVCTIKKDARSHYILSAPAQFRAAAYLDNGNNYYSVEEDVDFTGEVYFPLRACRLYGNGHTLSNIFVDLSECSYVGVVSSGAVEDLKVKNSSFVGADYVGGIAGYSYAPIIQCGFEGDVNGCEYVGGILGYGYEDYYSRDYAVEKSYVKGNIDGVEHVGGVVGNASCLNSYHIGETTGSRRRVGGISGGGSYSYNCYSYGTVSSGYGISPYMDAFYYDNNLTSSSYIFEGYSNDNCNCGPDKTFLSKLSVINSDEAYSTQVWKDIDAQCPLLQWQADALGGDVEVPGFGDEDW